MKVETVAGQPRRDETKVEWKLTRRYQQESLLKDSFQLIRIYFQTIRIMPGWPRVLLFYFLYLSWVYIIILFFFLVLSFSFQMEVKLKKPKGIKPNAG